MSKAGRCLESFLFNNTPICRPLLLTRISNDTLLQYLPEFLSFGIDTVQHKYILFTEAELSNCTQSSLTVCPANAEIYSTQMKICELSLYLQTTDSQNLCRRRLLSRCYALAECGRVR